MTFQSALADSLVCNKEKIAIEEGERITTYETLAATAATITRRLLGSRPGKEAIVGLMMDNRTDLICSIIGIINAGCVFVPIDPSLPMSRLSAICRELGLQYCLLSRSLSSDPRIADAFTGRKYILEDLSAAGETDAGHGEYPGYSEDDSLYIYFTSGTTGKPKGIVGKNCSLLQFIQWEIDTFHLDESSRVSQFISPYFDAFLRDIFVPLLAGGRICIPPAEADFFTPEKLIPWVDENRITLIHCVPSLFRVLNNGSLSPDRFATLKYILLSGEKIIPSELQPWYSIFGARIQLVNLYGATETTMIRAYYEIKPEDAHGNRIPIGRPIRDTELLVSNGGFKPCDPLVAGELYIISNYTTKGYWNDPELTKARFLPLFAGTEKATVAFRTGDKARILPNGNIDLLGREDRQVKLRGIRIELDEIEGVLARFESIRNAVVIKHTDDLQNESLLAFVVRKEGVGGSPAFTDRALEHLRAHLPEYMIPQDIVELKELPLLSNGKINYKELSGHRPEGEAGEPADDLEKNIMAIWKDLLGDIPMSTNDVFSRKGGNSLTMMRLIGRIQRQYAIRMTLGQLFSHMTIKKQAEFVRNSSGDDLMRISATPPKDFYNLSSSQERLFYHYELNKSSTAYNLPMAWRITGDYDKNKIENTFRALIARHESLRTGFRVQNGRIVQEIHDLVDFEIEEISGNQWRVDEALPVFVREFDLSRPPLIRGGILLRENGERVLLVDLHHIICDGMSQRILFSDFSSLYSGEQPDPLALQYKDYAEWERHFRDSSLYTSYREFWLKSFDGEMPKLSLPSMNAAGRDLSFRGGSLHFEIGHPVLGPMISLLKKDEMTTFSILFSIFHVYLSRITGQEDIVIGIASSGRMQQETENIVGMFAKTLPIRYRLDTGISFRELAAGVHAYLVQAYSRQQYDLSDIVNELNKGRETAVGELFDAMFVLQNFQDSTMRKGDSGFEKLELEQHTAKYPVSLIAAEGDRSFHFRFEYLQSYFSPSDARFLAEQFTSLAARIAGDPDTRIKELIAEGPQMSFMGADDIAFNF